MKAHQEQSVGNFIIPCGQVIAPTRTVEQAQAQLRKAHVRFLPVESKGKIVGLLKADHVEAATHMNSGKLLKVSQLMKRRPSVARADANLYEVLDQTPHNPYGCTVIRGKDGKVAGVFSSMDALFALRNILADR